MVLTQRMQAGRKVAPNRCGSIAGDCLQPGYDPPQSVVVLLDSELAEMEHTATPSVRMPRGFELVWKDEGDRADRCLSIWRPVPFPG